MNIEFHAFTNALDVGGHYMKYIITIWILISAGSISFCQSSDSIRSNYVGTIAPGHPLFVQYNYGGCFISTQQQLIIEATQSDSLAVTIKRYLPIAYRLYKYNERKKKYEPQDSIQIRDPFTFKFPPMGEKDYCTATKEYLYENSFSVSRLGLTKFLNEFIYLADNNKLELDKGVMGLYCNIQLTHDSLTKEYSFDGWYRFDLKIVQQQ
jgi:hypothetical protein